MKRLLILLFCISLCLNLIGCGFKEAVVREENEYIITSFGFDKQEENITALFEALVINSEGGETPEQPMLLKGEGKTLAEALNNIYKKTTRPLMLSHLGAVVIGDGVEGDTFTQIIKFCREKNEINISAQWFKAENAEKILSLKPVSSVAVGYDIMDMQSRMKSQQGIKFKNRFYELISSKQKPLGIFSLPRLETEEEELYIGGADILENLYLKNTVSLKDLPFFALATDTLTQGANYINDKECEIKSAYSQIDIKDNKAVLTVDLRTAGDYRHDFEKGIIRLFEESKINETDIFMIGNIIYSKNSRLWEKISSDYKSFYKNLKLSVKYK